MDRWINKVAVVTGASYGTGASMAKRLVEEGLQVVGLARSKQRLDKLATELAGKKGKLFPIATDLTKEEDILNAFKWIKKNLGPIHILVNNAGYLAPTSLYDGDTKIWKTTIDVNVLALCIATREAVRDMRANNISGHIIHINAVNGHQVINFPDFNVYAATKFAVTALTETLRLELNSLGLKIKTTSISPGGIDTESYREKWLKEFPLLESSEAKDILLQPEDITDSVIYVLSTPPHVQVHELTIKPVGETF